MFEPGTPVDIYCPADQPAGIWVWLDGYQISTSTKQRHQHISKKLTNPLTQREELSLVVQRGYFAFPVCQSHVRLASSPVWEFPKMNLPLVTLRNVVIADDSDRTDLESLCDLEDVVSNEE